MGDLLATARLFTYVREAASLGGNRGLRVEAVQHWSGGQAGDSWCMEMVWMWLDLAYHGSPPFGRMQAVEALHEFATQKGWIVPTPAVGDLVLSVTAEGHAHHVGVVTDLAPLSSIAGNTSADGTSSNGDGVYEHPISATLKVFVRLP